MQEEFLYTTKLWFAVHENSLIVDRETGRQRLKGVFRIASFDTGGKQAVAAFTDEDLVALFTINCRVTPRVFCVL